MPAKGWNNISLNDEDIKDILELGHWLIGDIGIDVTPPRSIRAMVKKLQAIRKDEGEKT